MWSRFLAALGMTKYMLQYKMVCHSEAKPKNLCGNERTNRSRFLALLGMTNHRDSVLGAE